MEICINGISANVIIGCYENERNNPQELIINLKAALYECNWNNCNDKLDETINYDELIDYVVKIVAPTKYELLEVLAEYLTTSILKQYALIEKVQIELIKPAICGIRAREIKISHNSKRKYKIALALGSNAENLPKQQLITAIELLNGYVGDIVTGGFYRTKPFGFTHQNDFYNTAITGYTSLTPGQLLSKIKKIEKLMGKRELMFNGPRVIDIDIILFDDLIYEQNFLYIPHKLAHLRDFVLQPLADIAPDLIHPVFKQNVAQLLNNLPMNERSIISKE